MGLSFRGINSVVVLDPVPLELMLHGPKGMVAKNTLKVGTRAAGIAQKLAPVDTGLLQSSIPGDSHMQGEDFYLGSHVTYAIYNEFGTWFMPATPYLRPAAAQAVGAPSEDLGSLVTLEGESD
jgi:hypothetical protein